MITKLSRTARARRLAFGTAVVWLTHCAAASALTFTPGDLVISVEGNGAAGPNPQTPGTFTDNQAAPLSLWSYTPTGTSSASFNGNLVLPQTTLGNNSAISGEYGSSSEGTLHLSGDGRFLTIMGYGVNANTFNQNPGSFSPDPTNTALGQSGSQTGQTYTAVPRVVALIGANGSVDTSTTVFNVFNTNNPRAAFTTDGNSVYISGQGASGDKTGGVFLTTRGSSSATAITGNDTSGKTAAQDTRDVQIVNNTLFTSVDSKQGSGSNRDFIGTLGTPPATSLFNNQNGPTMLPGFGNSGGTGKVTITAATTNGINSPGQEINLSPENFFFANSTTLYVADSGAPKNDSVTNDTGGSTLGNGGLQKWTFNAATGKWVLDYTLSKFTIPSGLSFVANTNAHGISGLYGLTGVVVGNSVELYATTFTLGDLDKTYLLGVTDLLNQTTNPNSDPANPTELFSVLAIAPDDANFKGVSFAPENPAPLPASLPMFGGGLGLIAWLTRGRKRRAKG